MINKEKIMKTKNLEEAVKEIFNLDLKQRTCILTKEAMTGEVAKQYDEIGKTARQETYEKITQDFKIRTGCYGSRYDIGTIVDVGSGSGLLSLKLADETNGYVLGIDLSKDMIDLANKKLEQASQSYGRAEFREGNVYELSKMMKSKKDINYIVCRNALHRFQDPEKAIKEMYSALAPGGKIYIRDLKRDADWETIVERIGEQRWQKPALVEDYIGAMAGMLTTKELQETLDKLGIKKYSITDGFYKTEDKAKQASNQMKEFASKVEYVCIIEKPGKKSKANNKQYVDSYYQLSQSMDHASYYD